MKPIMMSLGAVLVILTGQVVLVLGLNCQASGGELPITLHVDGTNGSDDNDGLTPETAFATIWKGVYVAENGDVVKVWPGTYYESVDFVGKAITVISAADAAVIDGEGVADIGGAIFAEAEGTDSVLSNFVLRNWTAGVFCIGSSPTIQHLTVLNNDYGAMCWSDSYPDISSSIFWRNYEADLYECEASYSFLASGAGPIEGMISYWPLDEGIGSTAGDSIGGNDGDIYGAQWTSGRIANALLFNGDGDYVDMGDQNSLDFGADDSFSVSVWIKGDKSDSTVFAKRRVDGGWVHQEGYMLRVYQDTLHLGLEDNSDTTVTIVGDSIVNDDQWHHVVAVRDAQADMLYLYLDGSPDATPIADPTGTLATNSSFRLGRLELYNRWFRGLIDEVAVFGRALPGEEVEQIYQHGAPDHPTEPFFADPCAGDYHLRSQHGRYDPSLELWVLDEVTSPAIDEGDPTVNPMAEPMPNGARVNMGAYSGTAYASRSVKPWPNQGDMNFDGIVNLLDLWILSDGWLWQAEWY